MYELYNHTLQEHIYASEDGVDLLSTVLKEKQDLMSEIDYLDRKFLVGFSDLKKELGVSSLEEMERTDDKDFADLRLNTVEILDTLKKIDSLDKKVQQKITKLRNDITQDLAKIKNQRRASKVYAEENAKNVMRDFGVYDAPKSSSFDAKK